MFELDKHGYSLDSDTAVWVRADYEGIAYSDGDSAENELAKIVRDAKDVSVFSSELSLHCTDWAKLYHLSASRGNIFRPFEHMLKAQSVLEIGAGCGAISRYLGEAGAQVLSLEGSPRRAAIAASRVRDLDNVTVLAERFDDFRIDRQFDVITLIGVLEYASMFSNDSNAACAMLARVYKLLKPNGRLFIAIENQLGLKYFAGAPEDHVGIPMYGIEGRYSEQQPQTFGRCELERLITKAGFASSSFLAPYPDYKIPNSIITEKGFESDTFDAAALACMNVRRDPQLPTSTTFNLEKAWPVIIGNHLGMDLANSFLVVASRQKENPVSASTLAYHYSTTRSAEYCKASVFVETGKGIEVQYHRLADRSMPAVDDDQFSFVLPAAHAYSQGTLLSQDFLKAAATQDWTVESFVPFMSRYLESLKQLLSSEGADIVLDQTDARLPGRYIDAVAQNIIIDSTGSPHLIDIEWDMRNGVELGQLLMRGLLLLIASATPFYPSSTMVSKRDFITRLFASVGLKITHEELDRYAMLEETFQIKVTGRKTPDWAPEATIQKLGSINIEEARLAALYIGASNGSFSEQRAEYRFVHDGQQTLVFTVPSTTVCAGLRFDPVNLRQPFSVDSIKLYVANSVVWNWQDGLDMPLDVARSTALRLPNDSTTMYMAMDSDPHVLLPGDINAAIAGKAFTIEIALTLYTEAQMADRLSRHEAELQSARGMAQESRHALIELEAASLAAQENHRRALVDKDTHVHNLNLHIIAMQSSHSWKVTAPLRKMTRAFLLAKRAAAAIPPIVRRGGGWSSTARKAFQVWRLRGLSGVIAEARWAKGAAQQSFQGKESRDVSDRHDYSRWVEYYDTLDKAETDRIIDQISHWIDSPVISIIMPVYNPPLDLLREAIESVRGQLYTRWELCIADDASTNPAVIEYLKTLGTQDNRIKVVFREDNGHISKASNSALAIAEGEFVALMDNDDLLPPHALYWIAHTIRENPDAGLVYSDEDKIDTNGVRSAPYFKSDWNEFLFRSQNMICHLAAYRRDLVEQVGQFKVGYEGAQDYDLALRCIDRLERSQIVHIPRVLYHWRIHAGSTAMAGDEKPYAALAGVKALDDHLKRKGDIGSAELLPTGMYRVHYNLPEVQPLVSLVIPTRNAHALVKQCIDSIKSLTTYPHYEIILIDNGSDDPDSLEYFAQLEQEENIRVLRDNGPFNYSALNNSAVRIANGELIGLINNDIEVITPEWLSEMVSIALQPKVGAVGARLWYPDDRLQHGGVIVGVGGVAGHSHKYLPKGAHGYFCRAELIQEFSAVTAACLIIKKSIFDEVDGLNEDKLKIAFNDVDFCLRVQEAGYLNVWTPYAELYHHESATRGLEDTPQKQARFATEINYVRSRWPNLMNDYAYNPNLTLDHEDFGLSWPPRVKN